MYCIVLYCIVHHWMAAPFQVLSFQDYATYFITSSSVFAEKGGAEQVSMCDASPVMIEICSAVMGAYHQQSHSSSQLHIFDARSTSLAVPEHLPKRYPPKKNCDYEFTNCTAQCQLIYALFDKLLSCVH